MNALDPATFPLSGLRLIEASAGTGKTYTITSLYLRLLLGRYEPAARPLGVNQILVLTFTIAATEELKDRIRRRIRDAARVFAGGETADDFIAHLKETSADQARDLKLLTAAQQLMDEASIYTIHSFCARVLGDNAFETGMLFSQSLDADRNLLLEQAVQDCFRADLLTLPDLERSVGLGLWNTPAALLKKLKPFLFRQDLTILPPAKPLDSSHLENLVREAKRRWLAEDFASVIRAAGFYANDRVVTRLDPMTAFCRSEELSTDLWPHWSSAAVAKARLKKTGTRPEHAVISLIDEICAALDQLPINLWHQVTRRVRAYLDHYRQDLGQFTLDDLLTGVQAALHSPTGDGLAATLAARWPVALIDEFQDTDDVQNDIFQRIYRAPAALGLFLIGDPKQAIYQFRGADVFTYINAKRLVDPGTDVFSLATNWRSTVHLVAAINHLFDQPDLFGNDRDIPFAPVKAADSAAALSFTREGLPVLPVTLMVDDAEETGTQDAVRQRSMAWAAEETVSLLQQGAAGTALINGEPLHAGQIAFLVRDRHDARAARDALGARGVRSVYVTQESVFLSDTAADLLLVLAAVLEPADEGAIRAALATPLMLATAAEIEALRTDPVQQQQVALEFAEYHRLWAESDIATMLESLILQRRLSAKWLRLADGERQLTNLRHLGELLQSRAAVAPGMHRLLKWFTREKRADERVSAPIRQLRLESDQDLVQIVTMHSAKGLEYEIVMIPLPGFSTSKRQAHDPSLLHQEQSGQFVTLLQLGDDEVQHNTAALEQAAEDMRLLYVAITRAKHCVYLGIPAAKALDRSALAKLLRLPASRENLPGALHDWLPETLFDIRVQQPPALTHWQPPATFDSLQPPRTRPLIARGWRVHSYTGVNRLLESGSEDIPGTVVVPGFGDDDQTAPRVHAQGPSRFTYPRGPRAGVALHTLLEQLDFTVPASQQVALLDQCLDRTGITLDRAAWQLILGQWLTDIVATPLAGTITLGQIPANRRLDELEFHFPLAADRSFVDLLKSAGYLDSRVTLPTGVLQGLMTGLIDLVFLHDNRYYLVDYKSNHLGDQPEDYHAAALQMAMTHHRYDLQYLIYTVALNRYLASSMPDYSYDKHFGGVCYLFLRGMSPSGQQGVFTDKPDAAFIQALDTTLGGNQ
ncbi:MAG: exodeoxyribonuclease V subunit beta [Pseudomonadota bacterium]